MKHYRQNSFILFWTVSIILVGTIFYTYPVARDAGASTLGGAKIAFTVIMFIYGWNFISAIYLLILYLKPPSGYTGNGLPWWCILGVVFLLLMDAFVFKNKGQ